ncbi:MAG: type II secretion system protein [bacterium]
MNRKGFTLVELLVAMSIFLLVAASFSALLKASHRSAQKAEALLQTTYQLQAKMEELRLEEFANLADATPVQPGLVKVRASLAGITLETYRSAY